MAKNPDAIKNATEKILQKVNELKIAIGNINRDMIEKWVNDLVIVKTFVGLKFQEAILIKGAEIKATTYRLSSSDEERQGIDGFIGNIPVSIKSTTYEVKAALQERINVKMIIYVKFKKGVEVDYTEIM